MHIVSQVFLALGPDYTLGCLRRSHGVNSTRDECLWFTRGFRIIVVRNIAYLVVEDWKFWSCIRLLRNYNMFSKNVRFSESQRPNAVTTFLWRVTFNDYVIILQKSAPATMFNFSLTSPSPTRYGPRIGNIILKRSNCHLQIPTPNLITTTSRGAVPHISRDHYKMTEAILWINVPFETLWVCSEGG